jgi:hypothetical protein
MSNFYLIAKPIREANTGGEAVIVVSNFYPSAKPILTTGGEAVKNPSACPHRGKSRDSLLPRNCY